MPSPSKNLETANPVQQLNLALEHPQARRTARRRDYVAGLERAIGFDQKIAQYDAGERFVRHVHASVGMEGLNLVWRGPDDLPGNAEIADPARWLARVAGS